MKWLWGGLAAIVVIAGAFFLMKAPAGGKGLNLNLEYLVLTPQ